MDSGSSDATEKPAPEPPMPAMMPLEQAAAEQSSSSASAAAQAEQAAKEQEDFEKLKRRIDAIVEREGLRAASRPRSAAAASSSGCSPTRSSSPRARPSSSRGRHRVLDSLGNVLAGEREHPVVVEGYTDSQPDQRGGQYPTNWELSGARAASVVRAFVASGVLHGPRSRWRGYAQQHPVVDATRRPTDGRATAGSRSILTRQPQLPRSPDQ